MEAGRTKEGREGGREGGREMEVQERTFAVSSDLGGGDRAWYLAAVGSHDGVEGLDHSQCAR